ncbi:VCBS repeat-containing protein [Ruegeria pomeroyi]|uniref:FG-GAP-like repeat-containing protein n=1 Tax=Ruegeria pomeroyi TaxID=89184 RepID=UPI001F3D013D|nr:FG-GAP-like repeat-containing protein [Ruegeria pomeroyi]MCE8510973.1 VCBS repeat-containing protein [Ruegeria pomeroyi]
MTEINVMSNEALLAILEFTTIEQFEQNLMDFYDTHFLDTSENPYAGEAGVPDSVTSVGNGSYFGGARVDKLLWTMGIMLQKIPALKPEFANQAANIRGDLMNTFFLERMVKGAAQSSALFTDGDAASMAGEILDMANVVDQLAFIAASLAGQWAMPEVRSRILNDYIANMEFHTDEERQRFVSLVQTGSSFDAIKKAYQDNIQEQITAFREAPGGPDEALSAIERHNVAISARNEEIERLNDRLIQSTVDGDEEGTARYEARIAELEAENTASENAMASLRSSIANSQAELDNFNSNLDVFETDSALRSAGTASNYAAKASAVAGLGANAITAASAVAWYFAGREGIGGTYETLTNVEFGTKIGEQAVGFISGILDSVNSFRAAQSATVGNVGTAFGVAGAVAAGAAASAQIALIAERLNDDTLTDNERNLLKAEIGMQAVTAGLGALTGVFATIQAAATAGSTAANAAAKAVPILGGLVAVASAINPAQWAAFGAQHDYIDSVRERDEFSSDRLADVLDNVLVVEEAFYGSGVAVSSALGILAAGLTLAGVTAPVGIIVGLIGAAVQGILQAVQQTAIEGAINDQRDEILDEFGTFEAYFDESFDERFHAIRDDFAPMFDKILEEDPDIDAVVGLGSQTLERSDLELAGTLRIREEMGKTAKHYHEVYTGQGNWQSNEIDSSQARIELRGGYETSQYLTFITPLMAPGSEKFVTVRTGKNEYKTTLEIIDSGTGWTLSDIGDVHTAFDISRVVTRFQEHSGAEPEDLVFSIKAGSGDDRLMAHSAELNFDGGSGEDAAQYTKGNFAGLTVTAAKNTITVDKHIKANDTFYQESIETATSRVGKRTETVEYRTLEMNNTSRGYTATDTLTNVEVFYASAGDDILNFSNSDQIREIFGFDGDDLIYLSRGTEVVAAGDGDDVIVLTDEVLSRLDNSQPREATLDKAENLRELAGTDAGDFKGDNQKLTVGDFNGDGLADFIAQDKGTANTARIFWGQKDGSFSEEPGGLHTIDNVIDDGSGFGGTSTYGGVTTNLIVGDFNGDGRDDFIRQENGAAGTDDGQWTAQVFLSTYNDTAGDYFIQRGQLEDLTGSTGQTGDPFLGRNSVMHSADFNGDGLDDLFVQRYDSSRGQLYLSNGSSDGRLFSDSYSVDLRYQDPATGIEQRFSLDADQANVILGDFDGDGDSDILYQGRSAGSSAQVFLYQEGQGFIHSGELNLYSDHRLGVAGNVTNLIVGDFNGDGRDDIIRQEKGNWDNDLRDTAQLFLSDGNGDFTYDGELREISGYGSDGFKGDGTNLIVGDFNGDGIDGFIRQEKGSWDNDDYDTAQVVETSDNRFLYVTGDGGSDTVALSSEWAQNAWSNGVAEAVALYTAQGMADTQEDQLAVADVINRSSNPLYSLFASIVLVDVEFLHTDFDVDLLSMSSSLYNNRTFDMTEWRNVMNLSFDTVPDNVTREQLNMSVSFAAADTGLVVKGSEADDKIIGSQYDDVLFGDAGDDVLYGGGGADTLSGGAGQDTYELSLNNTTLIEAGSNGNADASFDRFKFDLSNYAGSLQLFKQDVTGDGNLDLIIARSGSSTDKVIISNFFDDQLYGAEADHEMFEFMRGDGKQSFTKSQLLVTTFLESGTYSRANNESAWADMFNPVTTYAGDLRNLSGLEAYEFKGDSRNIVVGDFNGDGRDDFIRQEKGFSANGFRNTAQVFLSQTDGSFRKSGNLHSLTSGDEFITDPYKGDLTNLIVGDFNGDGVDDFIRQEKGSWDDDNRYTAHLFLSDAGQGFYEAGDLRNLSGLEDYEFKGDSRNIVIGDFNGDGRDDFIRQEKGLSDNDNLNTAQVFLSHTDGSFRKSGDLHSLTSGDEFSSDPYKGDLTNLIVADFNGDGVDDFIRQEKGSWDDDDSRTAQLFFGDGDGTFTYQMELFSALPRQTEDDLKGDNTTIFADDFNGDGYADVLLHTNSNDLKLYLFDGQGFRQSVTIAIDAPRSLTKLVLGDFDGDGDADIIRQEMNRWDDDNHRTVELYDLL